ncbi:MAG TPA: hypothetical protein VFQ65_20745 [Kofleriaceae bacterium]|nr:hypothetical protein [Kofleriaceae bacterium]
MTERTPRFDPDEIDLLFAEAEERPATPVTAALPGAFSSPLPRGVELANVDNAALPLGRGDGDITVVDETYPSATTPGSSARDVPTAFSPHHTVMASAENLRLAVAFDHLELELARLNRRWESTAPRGRIDAIVGDFASFMRILLEDVELEPIYSRSAETSLLVHDTYVRLITVGGVLREALEGRWANAADLESAYAHAEATLDAFTPFVGLADRAMRRICLEAETLEGALRWLSRQLDEEAAERLRAAEAYVPRRAPGSSYRDN